MKAIERVLHDIDNQPGMTPFGDYRDDEHIVLDGRFTRSQIVAMADAMEWIKIEPGCEMPKLNDDDPLLVMMGCYPYFARRWNGEWRVMTPHAGVIWILDRDVTHWRRVGLPK